MPTLRGSQEHTDRQLTVIADLLDQATAAANVVAGIPGSTVLTGATTTKGTTA